MLIRGSCFLASLALAALLLAACIPEPYEGTKDAPPPPLAPPTGVTIAAGDAQVSLTWDAVPGATGYHLYWSNSPGVTKATGSPTANVTSPYTHTGLANGATYYYVVTAVNASRESAESAEVGATPQAPASGVPTGVTVTAGNGQVTISWSAVTGATSYNLYWRNTSGVTRLSGNRIADVTSPFTHAGLVNGSTYYYVVTAVTASGESAESAEVGATPQVPAPGAPTGVTVTAGNGQVTISWSAVTNATSYNLYFSTSTGVTKTTGTKITGVSSPYAHTALTNGTTYFYVVTAVSSAGESPESAQVLATPVPAPTGVSATAGNGQVTVSWSAITGATSYNLYFGTSTGVTKTNGTKIAGVTSPYTHTGRTNGTTYFYVVTAVNAGSESAESAEVSARPSSLSSPTQVSAGEGHTCALHAGGLACWGSNSYGQTTVPALTNPTQVSAGQGHTCAVHAGGLACWGNNDSGQINVPALTNPTQVEAGYLHTCALHAGGLACWGFNQYGQTNVPALTNPTQVSAARYHTCAVHGGGVARWGGNDNGQTNVPALTNPTQVSAGLFHTCALHAGGVACWGYNGDGQTMAPALTNPTQVSAGAAHTCALHAGGVACWGRGQTTVPALTNPTQVSAGGYHSCALHAGGVACWGDNSSGQTNVP
jgi:fibronectin type 3 domain-containing protein